MHPSLRHTLEHLRLCSRTLNSVGPWASVGVMVPSPYRGFRRCPVKDGRCLELWVAHGATWWQRTLPLVCLIYFLSCLGGILRARAPICTAGIQSG